jgi:hypothetical protein
MSPLEAVVVLVALSAFPSAMFLALCRGLERLQESAVDAGFGVRGGELRVVTLGDAVRGVFGQRREDRDSSPPQFRR